MPKNSPRILFHSTWNPANANRWFSEGFEQAGCTVIRSGRPDPGFANVDWESRPPIDICTDADPRTPVDLGKIVAEQQPDMLLIWDVPEANYLSLDTVRCPIVVYNSEGWPGDFQKSLSLPATVRYTQMPYGVRQHPGNAFRDGFLYLPGACDPYRHPYPDREGDRPIDVNVLGGEYEWRVRLCKDMNALGYNTVYGKRNISGYALAGRNSLCMVSHSNFQAYIGWRVFEAMAMGAIVLYDRDSRVDDLMSRLGFADGEHYLSIRVDADAAPTTESVVERVKELRSDKNLHSRIQRNAYCAVMSRHTYCDRAMTILSDVGITPRSTRHRGTTVVVQAKVANPLASWEALAASRPDVCFDNWSTSEEREWLLKEICAIPRNGTFAEIGCSVGANVAAVAAASTLQKTLRKIIAVDDWTDRPDLVGTPLYDRFMTNVLRSVSADPVFDVIDDSSLYSCVNTAFVTIDVRSKLASKASTHYEVSSIDFVHVDTRDATRSDDIVLWGERVRPGGTLWIEGRWTAATKSGIEKLCALVPGFYVTKGPCDLPGVANPGDSVVLKRS